MKHMKLNLTLMLGMDGSGKTKPIYTIKSTSGGVDEPVTRIKESDFLEDTIEGKNIFLNAILYYDKNDVINNVEGVQDFITYYGNTIQLADEPLYERLQNKNNITEEAGVYSIVDTQGAETEEPEEEAEEDITESNANEKKIRVIRYVVN